MENIYLYFFQIMEIFRYKLPNNEKMFFISKFIREFLGYRLPDNEKNAYNIFLQVKLFRNF